MWAEEELKVVGVDLTYNACPRWLSEIRFGLSYYVDDEYYYKGITGSGRIQFGNRLTPFAGIGLLAGSAERKVEASTDGVDNDDDGFVDERGEKEVEYEASMFLYPEVGIAYQTKAIGFTLSARRYYGSEFSGNTIFSFGLSLPLKQDD